MKVIFILALVALASYASANKKVVCYWGTWAAYRRGHAKFTIDNIDPRLCTHIIYSFFGANNDGTWKSLDPYLDLSTNGGRGYIAKFINLKRVNPRVKLMASIGGWSMGGSLFGRIAANPGLRSRFAASVLQLLQKFRFDGFDLDWEYPKSHEKGNFVAMLRDLSVRLRPAGKLLTIAVGATEKRGRISYDIRNILRHVDFINLMTYDLHGAWDRRTGLNAPLYSHDHLSVDSCVRYWLSQGCPKEKLIMGMGLYGRSFTLQTRGRYDIGVPASAGRAGSFIPGTAGFLPYNEICMNVKVGGWTRKFAQHEKTPYAFKGDQWVGYDDPESNKYKLDYLMHNRLGGAMFWSIETDDFGNICGQGRFPLLVQAYRRLHLANDEYKNSTEAHIEIDLEY